MLINAHTGEIRLENTDSHLIFTAEAFTWMEGALKTGTMELLRKAASMEMSMTEVQVVISAGMEAWRRRNGNQGKPVTPSKALKLIEATGGIVLAIGQIAEAFEHAPSLGLQTAKAEEEKEDDAVDPTIGEELSEESSGLAFLQPRLGS